MNTVDLSKHTVALWPPFETTYGRPVRSITRCECYRGCQILKVAFSNELADGEYYPSGKPVASGSDIISSNAAPKPSKFWLVWRASGRNPAFRHFSLGAAEKEADRLSKQNPGCAFFVVGSEAMVNTPKPPQPVTPPTEVTRFDA
jgi:hypothetical protein